MICQSELKVPTQFLASYIFVRVASIMRIYIVMEFDLCDNLMLHGNTQVHLMKNIYVLSIN